ncbi:MAG: nickel pincer cofactor biosynthesis protein LarC [Acidobacteriota bacterium]
MDTKGFRKILYFDCFSGISGDMLLGALIDLGIPFSYLKKELNKLKLTSLSLAARKVKRDGISATKFDVFMVRRKGPKQDKGGRNLSEISKIIERSSLEKEIKDRSIGIFRKMIEAEAKVHMVPGSKMHLHEMGAIDAIVDVVGACIAFKRIGVDEILSSPINVGRGFARCEHGIFPIPAPATMEILKGVPIYSRGDEAELTTPTGASIISSFASRFLPIPEMEAEKVGYGAGSRELKSHPNLLRVVMGRARIGSGGMVSVIETTIDDMNLQIFGYLMETLFKNGALEVFYTNVIMKKNRPGILVTVICSHQDRDKLIGILFRETTTIGVRFRNENRQELERRIETVQTRFGKIRVKKSFFDGKVSQASSEYDDCAKAARRHNAPLKEVQQEALKKAKENLE